MVEQRATIVAVTSSPTDTQASYRGVRRVSVVRRHQKLSAISPSVRTSISARPSLKNKNHHKGTGTFVVVSLVVVPSVKPSTTGGR